MFGDMMEKLQKMQQEMEESKQRLATVSVQGKADGILVVMDGNRKVKDITIDPSITEDIEDLQDLLIVAFNKALEAAENANQAEMASKAQGLLGGMM